METEDPLAETVRLCVSQQLNLQLEEPSSTTLDLKASPRMSRASTFLTQILQVEEPHGTAVRGLRFLMTRLKITFAFALLRSSSAGWT